MYGTVAEVAEAFDAQQWDPATDVPGTATVTAWLERWSTVLDAEIGHVVTVPVDATDSPNLSAECALITVLRVQAEVYDGLHPAGGEQVTTRQSHVWREQAADLVKGIKAGAVADGEPLGGRSPETPGAPDGYFGDGPVFSGEQKF